MATKKSNVKKEEIVEEVKETKNQESEEMIALRKQIEEMKKAMELLMKNKANTPSERVYVKQAKDEVVIGCRVLQGIGWGRPEDPAGEIRLDFNEEQSVTVSDMKRFFRQNSIRRLFEDGLCYFAEPENYTLFNIRKHIDLSNENLINILTQDDINDIIRNLDIVFRICDMIRTNVLTWDYYSRKAIEGYFDMEFDRGISTLTALDKIKR